MGTKCVLSACKKRFKNKKSPRCHGFPKDLVTRRKWSLWVAERNGYFKDYSASAALCCEHFAPTCYRMDVYGVDYSSNLNKDAVPSIDPEPQQSIEEKIGEGGSPQDVVEVAPLAEDAVPLEGNVSSELVTSSHTGGGVPLASAVMAHTPETLNCGGRKVYVGDLSPRDFSTPRRARRNLLFTKTQMCEIRKRLNNTQGQLHRAKARIKNLEGIIQHLKDKNIINAEMAEKIEVNFED